jgi:hypothetical protein
MQYTVIGERLKKINILKNIAVAILLYNGGSLMGWFLRRPENKPIEPDLGNASEGI